eukprot:9485061-Pyramimonas_sp.AAC.1
MPAHACPQQWPSIAKRESGQPWGSARRVPPTSMQHVAHLPFFAFPSLRASPPSFARLRPV